MKRNVFDSIKIGLASPEMIRSIRAIGNSRIFIITASIVFICVASLLFFKDISTILSEA